MNEKSDNYDKKILEDPTCYKCNGREHCATGRPNIELDNCPIKMSPEIQKKAIELYKTNEFIKKSNIVATLVKQQGSVPRLKDILEFAKGMGYNKLGIASCVALQKETEKTAEILNKSGFEVSSVCCQTGANKRIDVDAPDDFTFHSKGGYHMDYVTCNPVAQALLLNKAKTELNIIIGLCIGHDITFTHLSEAPVTTLIAKDRLIRHNPSATLNSYYNEFS